MGPRSSSSRRFLRLAAIIAAGAAAIGMTIAVRHVQPVSPPSVRSPSFLAPPFSTESGSEGRAAAVASSGTGRGQTVFAADLARASEVSDVAWGEADPRAAFFHLLAHGTSEADRYRCGIYFRQWARRDFGAAFDHAERASPGMWREETLGWLALVVAEADPAEAALMAGRDMRPGPVRIETSISILHQWARVDLAAAAAWADSFPRGPVRDRALDEIAGFMRDVPPPRSVD